MKKKLALILITLIVLILIGLYFFLNSEKKQETILRKEVSVLVQKDVTKDKYDLKVKTTGDYGVVEKVIKQYYKDYSTNIKNVFKILEDEELKQVLSATNYKEDGGDFVKTKKLIKKSKKNLNQYLDNLTKLSDKKEIMKRINKEHLNKYYVNLYKDIMLTGVSAKTFEKTKKTYDETSKKLNNKLAIYEDVINLLSQNKDKWSINNDKIQFKDSETLNKYNSLVKQL